MCLYHHVRVPVCCRGVLLTRENYHALSCPFILFAQSNERIVSFTLSFRLTCGFVI